MASAGGGRSPPPAPGQAGENSEDGLGRLRSDHSGPDGALLRNGTGDHPEGLERAGLRKNCDYAQSGRKGSKMLISNESAVFGCIDGHRSKPYVAEPGSEPGCATKWRNKIVPPGSHGAWDAGGRVRQPLRAEAHDVAR